MKTDIQVGSKVKVIDKKSIAYRLRGTVVEEKYESRISLLTGEMHELLKSFVCDLHDELGKHQKIELFPEQIACIQKKFIDIEQLRDSDIDLGNGLVRKSNADAFEAGDMIQITEKIDGANASIAWNPDEDKLEVFSRTNLLDGVEGLRGFKAYVLSKFDPKEFAECPNLVIFGEWCVSHSVKYDAGWYNVWRVYDIWDKDRHNYLLQDEVKAFCLKHGLEYIHVLYDGPFVSWDHCRSFLHANTYGSSQEGVVVKNQTKLGRNDIRAPKYLKIVNKEFIESHVKAHKEPKEIDPEQLKLEAEAKAKMSEIVTEARVKKMILKCVDNGIVPQDLEPKCIGTLMKVLPKQIFEDCMKEEPDVVRSVGALAGKLCSGLVAQHVKVIVLGK